MEARRGKGLSNRGSAATTRVSSAGKENICPSLISRDPVGASRSPLPEGFPRAPLQDITHILSPINILPDDGDASELGPCPRRKRSKCVGEIQTKSIITQCDLEIDSSEMKWPSGLRKCVSFQAAVRDLHVKGESKPTEGVQFQVPAKLTENVEVEVKETFSEVQGAAKGDLKMETRETEQFVCTEIASMEEKELKVAVVESSSMIRSRKAVPAKLHKQVPSSPVTLRSAQQKPKMSSIMKFR